MRFTNHHQAMKFQVHSSPDRNVYRVYFCCADSCHCTSISQLRSHNPLRVNVNAQSDWLRLAGFGGPIWSLAEDAGHVARLPWGRAPAAAYTESHRLLHWQASLPTLNHLTASVVSVTRLACLHLCLERSTGLPTGAGGLGLAGTFA